MRSVAGCRRPQPNGPFCVRPARMTAMSDSTTYRNVIYRLLPGDAATANQLLGIWDACRFTWNEIKEARKSSSRTPADAGSNRRRSSRSEKRSRRCGTRPIGFGSIPTPSCATRCATRRTRGRRSSRAVPDTRSGNTLQRSVVHHPGKHPHPRWKACGPEGGLAVDPPPRRQPVSGRPAGRSRR